MSPTFLDRLKVEEHELYMKLLKLDVFMMSDTFDALCEPEKHDLQIQKDCMTSYLATLVRRIRRAG